MKDLPTMEQLLKKSPLQSIRDYANQHAIIGNVEFTYPDGTVMTRKQWHRAMKRDEFFWDDMTAQVAKYERAQLEPGETLPQWLKDADLAAFHRKKRTQKGAA